MNFLVKHLKDAKKASGSNESITIRDYFKHAIISCKEGCLLVYAAFASFVHGIFPWWYGFELIQWQIDMLKRLKKGLPHLKVWEQIEFKDEEDK
jgi:hypothetical protein